MSDLKLANDGDLDLSTGDAVLITGLDEARQRVQIKLRFFKGEWFVDPTFGMPWFRDVLIKNPQIDVVRDVIVRGIETEPGIDKVTEIILSFDTIARSLSITSLEVLADGEFINFQDFQVVEL